MAPETADRRDARPTARIDGGAINSARVMVEAFRLASDATDAPRILNGILDGLVSLVDHDAAGVYVVDALGERIFPQPRARLHQSRAGRHARAVR